MAGNTKKNRKQPKISRRTRNRIALTISILIVVTIAYWAVRKPDGPSDTSVQQSAVTSNLAGSTPRSLPTTLPPSNFSDPSVAHVYLVARQIPAVVAEQPCYCNCGKFGHRNLLDCYRTDHAAG